MSQAIIPQSSEQSPPQVTLRGWIKPNRIGGECINFTINLGFFKLVCIVNVPTDEDTGASVPVYVKFLRQGE